MTQTEASGRDRSEVPNQYEQAREAARDDPDLTELSNMIYGLPDVSEVLVDGRDEEWRPVEITIGFPTDGYRGTGDVLDIMRSAGWQAENVTFAPYNRIRFREVSP